MFNGSIFLNVKICCLSNEDELNLLGFLDDDYRHFYHFKKVIIKIVAVLI